MFVHVVNFWLQKDLTDAERQQFLAGVKSLGNIDACQTFNVGTPAKTDRPVIDNSYDYCLLTIFNDIKGHDVYQEHPIHLKFIDECKHLWEKVLIYDSETV
jgi:Stress responsive A/B Barrel Domain